MLELLLAKPAALISFSAGFYFRHELMPTNGTLVAWRQRAAKHLENAVDTLI